MRVNVKLAALLGLILFACSSPQIDIDYSVPNFPKEHAVEIQKLGQEELVYGSPYSVTLYEDNIILQSRNVDNKNVFQVVSAKDGKHKTAFGYTGRGENELTDYVMPMYDANLKRICAIDNNGKFIAFDLKKAMEGDPKCVCMSHKMPKYPTTSQVLVWGDRLIHAEGKPRLFSTNIEGRDTIVLYDSFPKAGIDDDTDRSMYFNYQSHAAIRPDGKKMCNITGEGMIMEIWDLSERGAEQRALRYFFKPQMKSFKTNTPMDNAIRGAYYVYATDKYIYCGYYDQPWNDNNPPRAKLAVFYWNGKEVSQYIVNDRLSRFAVTPDDMRVYCWTRTASGDSYLGYFDLK